MRMILSAEKAHEIVVAECEKRGRDWGRRTLAYVRDHEYTQHDWEARRYPTTKGGATGRPPSLDDYDRLWPGWKGTARVRPKGESPAYHPHGQDLHFSFPGT